MNNLYLVAFDGSRQQSSIKGLSSLIANCQLSILNCQLSHHSHSIVAGGFDEMS